VKRSALFFVLALLSACAAADNFGSYVGRVVVAWNEDGRTMTLLEPFAYVDPRGVRWEAPPGTRIDGASIPQFAWSIIGGPFEGKYRAPSIVHDVACEEKKHDWQDVHRMFLDGMLAAGVDSRIASIMYAAVYHFGPRWPREIVASMRAETKEEIASLTRTLNGTRRKNEQPGELVQTVATRSLGPKSVVVQFKPEPPRLSPPDFETLKSAILRQNLTLEQIENYAGRGEGRR
jgi:hypothetical protein